MDMYHVSMRKKKHTSLVLDKEGGGRETVAMAWAAEVGTVVLAVASGARLPTSGAGVDDVQAAAEAGLLLRPAPVGDGGCCFFFTACGEKDFVKYKLFQVT